MEIISEAPFAEVVSFSECKPHDKLLYDVKVDHWRNRFNDRGKEPYNTLPGDIVVLANAKPETFSDLQRVGRTWAFAMVTNITEDENEDASTSTYFKVQASKPVEVREGLQNSLVVIFLINATTNKRIWNALHMHGNLNIIKEFLSADSVVRENCALCSVRKNEVWDAKCAMNLSSMLNESQTEAVLASLEKMQCNHKSSVELIWGPPGTGKTKTVSILLFNLLRMKCRTLTCAPTNVAVVEVATRYNVFLENELIKEKDRNHESENKEKKFSSKTEVEFEGNKSFLDFVRERFKSTALPLKNCLLSLCTHISESYILKHNRQNITSLVGFLDSFDSLLSRDDVISEDIEEVFACPELVEDYSQGFSDILLMLCLRRRDCLSLLKSLRNSLRELNLPSAMNKSSIVKFCFEKASLIFCTASSSYKLHSLAIEPLNLLVIDEAAQLKECESAIPLKIPGLRHAILIGDECQLPATVESKASDKSGFGRSLFERLSLLGHPKHLLNMQYRMHPFISCFPNSKFYFNEILDAPNVVGKSYEKHYLPGPMFGPYSFINVFDGREELDDVGRSRRNMVEVAIVSKLVQSLHKAWNGSKQKLRIGVISPYVAQVTAIQEKIGHKYENINGFSVKVKSVDGFQGGEEDVIIISTVRANRDGRIGFMSNPRRVNVAITRARHCLWILGNERTLTNSESIWKELVCDAKNRHCFFSADEDKQLAKIILEVKKEFDQLDDLLNGDSVFFKSARWKVLFSENFKRSFGKLASIRTKTSTLNLLLRLSSGWRPKKRNVDFICDSLNILKQFKVEGLYVICSIDIQKEQRYTQVLKVWDILPVEEIPRLVKRLNGIFQRYTDDFISRCNEKFLEGGLEVPKTWSTSFDIVQFKSLVNNEGGSNLSSNDKCYVENSKVSDSLLLMKFYPLSRVVVSHLLSDPDGLELELPFEVTDEEREIILFQKSSFILGRSGTGKTTVLTMKLFKKEQLFHKAVEGYGEESDNTSKDAFQRIDVDDDIKMLKTVMVRLRMLFCASFLFASGGKYSAGHIPADRENIDDAAQFKDIPDSLIDIPPELYPLVITFNKFLMMLDGTIGNSYFEKFPGLRQLLHGKMGSSGSIAMQTFIRTREVNYEKFCSNYWPHFNAKFTKKLDSSRVFTEIMSQIKGGLKAGESSDGRLSRGDYIMLSEGRISTLSKKQRETIYDAFEDYEKMKKENGDFDLADLVNDLHHRLKNENYLGNMMDFVYIDEVQDLTMRQVALFKHISKNVSEGFVFSGDTAQTIARGIDFRFEDIRSLFYNEFVLGSRSEGNERMKEKGQLSKIFHLKQNFRTHAGVLKLAQSVIDLLYRFFRPFIDVLDHETSQIFGEAPILIESGNDENAIVSIFGNNGNMGGSFVGFGAEQVILVRDDSARKETCNYVGKQALVLTIMECKGLEFQDVLLYNFFGSSPLKNKWRVIYEYMKEQNLLDASSPSVPSFNPGKHNVLCSELKQLYVAITRTRQRLWICENIEEFSKPMFDYWRKKALVQVRQLDDSLALAMQVASSPEEWKSQGYKLLCLGNYEMATMCFERAGDEYGEKLAKASGLRAAAEKMQASNPEMASTARRQAAEIFEAIGKAEYAAECFFMLKEYERAGKIYLKCGDFALEKAGECFYLAGCYKFAAEVYAKGNHFSKCLSACTEGKLFDVGLQYIQYWKQHVTEDIYMVKRSEEMDKIEREFLESCALHYHELNDNRAMMKYVRAFDSIASIRTFLENLGCLDELLLFEEESGNFLEAAKIAKQKGELLHEADLLGKAGHFKDASLLILWYVFASSLWSFGSKGWPLKEFTEKVELLTKAESFAKNDSRQYYEFVHMEAGILLNNQCSLSTMKQHLNASQGQKSIRGEILSARKILDAHLNLNACKYEWENDMVLDLTRFSENKISKNQVCIETLVYFWNFWKDNIGKIFEYLRSLETQDASEFRSYGEFCLNYLGFVSAAQSYWSAELLSVGLDVLIKLEALYILSVKNSFSFFCQSRALNHIYEIAKFLFNSEFLDRRHSDNKALLKFIGLSYEHLFGCIYPLDWKESLKKNMISMRRTKSFRNLIKEVASEAVSVNNKLSYGQLGRISLAILGSGKPCDELYKKIVDGLRWNASWMALMEDLCLNSGFRVLPDNNTEIPLHQLPLKLKLHGALVDTYNANWRKENDYISPGDFLYLVERQLILLSYSRGFFLTTKSSFTEWLIYLECDASQTSSSVELAPQSANGILGFLANIVRQLLYNKMDMMEWIRKCHTNAKDCYAFVILRLVVIACLLSWNYGLCRDLLFELLGMNYITDQLPRQFYNALQNRWKKRKFLNASADLNVLADAFQKIGNPLVIVSLDKSCPQYSSPNAIFLDMVGQSKEDMFTILFPHTSKANENNKENVALDTTSPCKGVASPAGYDHGKGSSLNEENLPCPPGELWEILGALKSMNQGEDKSTRANDQKIKANIGKIIHFLSAALNGCLQKGAPDNENDSLYGEAAILLEELKQLFAALDMSGPELENDISRIEELVSKLESRRPRLENFINQKMLQQDESLGKEASDDSKFDENVNNEVMNSESSDKGKINDSQATVASGNEGSSCHAENKGSKKKPKRKAGKGKGGRKNK
ncbi:hypothetical protein GH714_032328 [Hevea brasiliensis]|uniref:UvrD-like helicase ATP-binding domain-containing protein n=1 Tax=Hevea brasiliensis TaxID=3981 RepID=A0A6A6N6M2_HEVBR|nr:hypothetical protein GH714_032328 [Hevea brasiliensis]